MSWKLGPSEGSNGTRKGRISSIVARPFLLRQVDGETCRRREGDRISPNCSGRRRRQQRVLREARRTTVAVSIVRRRSDGNLALGEGQQGAERIGEDVASELETPPKCSLPDDDVTGQHDS